MSPTPSLRCAGGAWGDFLRGSLDWAGGVREEEAGERRPGRKWGKAVSEVGPDSTWRPGLCLQTPEGACSRGRRLEGGPQSKTQA